MVPIGVQIARIFPSTQFAAVIAFISGSYIAADASEIVGSLFGKRKIILPLERAGEAYDRMMSGQTRFRVVLTTGA